MFQILDLEEIYILKFGNGKSEGYLHFTYTDYHVKIIIGKDTEGNAIPPKEINHKIQGKINPTKVILFIARVLKKVLCPSCL